MNASQHFDIQATHYSGMSPSVLFLFRDAERAAAIWRFTHRTDATQLRVFADTDGAPIGIQFRELTPCLEESSESATPVDHESLRENMHKFAEMMIAYGQLEQGLDLIKDAIAGIPVPEGQAVDVSIASARRAVCAAV